MIETLRTLEHPVAWSHDEKSLLVFTSDDKGTYLSSWSFASRTLARVIGPRVLDTPAFFSPHDDFVAFNAQESGRPEVYVTTFPDHRQTWPLTTEGGEVLSWRNDGHEILVATLSGHIAAYPVSTDRGFSQGEPTTLVRDIGSLAVYSTATRDHARILIRVSADAAKDKGEMQLLFGWQDALRQGASTERGPTNTLSACRQVDSIPMQGRRITPRWSRYAEKSASRGWIDRSAFVGI